MSTQQLSIFLENKSGRLAEVTDILSRNGINIAALSLAETSEYGILRCVVSDPSRAREVLKAAHFAVSLTEVICVSISNEPGSLHAVVRALSAEQISVEYMYAFAVGGRAMAMLRTDDTPRTIDVLTRAGVAVLTSRDVYGAS